MISDEHVRVERSNHVVTVTLDRPGTRNACTMNMWLAIRDAFREISASDARCVLLTGANGDFCSGADLSPSATNTGWEHNKLLAMRQLGESVMAVHTCPVPVVVKVPGVAVGAGFGLALAGDMLWCSETARMSAVFAKLGLSLDYGSSWFLGKRIGLHRAMEVALTAEMLGGERIKELGLANAVVPADELDEVVDAVVQRIAARSADGVVDDEADARELGDVIPPPGAGGRSRGAEREPGHQGHGRGDPRLRREAAAGIPGRVTWTSR